jgi:hypothetical protein
VTANEKFDPEKVGETSPCVLVGFAIPVGTHHRLSSGYFRLAYKEPEIAAYSHVPALQPVWVRVSFARSFARVSLV